MSNGSRRVLIVEDDYFIASDLTKAFADAGLEIVGPVPSVKAALAAIEAGPVDGAVLDINLNGETAYEIADALIARGASVVFVTGYERRDIPERYRSIPLCLKPVDGSKVVEALWRIADR